MDGSLDRGGVESVGEEWRVVHRLLLYYIIFHTEIPNY